MKLSLSDKVILEMSIDDARKLLSELRAACEDSGEYPVMEKILSLMED